VVKSEGAPDVLSWPGEQPAEPGITKLCDTQPEVLTAGLALVMDKAGCRTDFAVYMEGAGLFGERK